MSKLLRFAVLWLCAFACGPGADGHALRSTRPESAESRDVNFYAPTRLRVSHLRDSTDVLESIRSSRQQIPTRVRTGMSYGWKTQLYYRDGLQLVPVCGPGGSGNAKTNLPLEGQIGGLVIPRNLYAARERGGSLQLIVEFTLFETDIPCQHLWQPGRSSQYRELWQGLAVGEWRTK